MSTREFTGAGSGEVFLPGAFAGWILVDEDGNETRYTPEEWRHKQLCDRLDLVISHLIRIAYTLERMDGKLRQPEEGDPA